MLKYIFIFPPFFPPPFCRSRVGTLTARKRSRWFTSFFLLLLSFFFFFALLNFPRMRENLVQRGYCNMKCRRCFKCVKNLWIRLDEKSFLVLWEMLFDIIILWKGNPVLKYFDNTKFISFKEVFESKLLKTVKFQTSLKLIFLFLATESIILKIEISSSKLAVRLFRGISLNFEHWSSVLELLESSSKLQQSDRKRSCNKFQTLVVREKLQFPKPRWI